MGSDYENVKTLSKVVRNSRHEARKILKLHFNWHRSNPSHIHGQDTKWAKRLTVIMIRPGMVELRIISTDKG
jgi:hypothetical protein